MTGSDSFFVSTLSSAAPPRGKKKKTKVDWSSLGVETEGGTGAVDLDGADERASQEGGDEEGGDNVEEMEDYEEEADDNDYEMNYFDNGEDENDDLGDGGGDPDGGGGGDGEYLSFHNRSNGTIRDG